MGPKSGCQSKLSLARAKAKAHGCLGERGSGVGGMRRYESSVVFVGEEVDEEVAGLEVVADGDVDGGDGGGERGGDDGLHLHGGEDDEGLAGLDRVARLDAGVDDDAGHGGADLGGVVGVCLGALDDDVVGVCVVDFDGAREAVELEEYLARAGGGVEGADAEELDEEVLAALDGDVDLLAGLEGLDEGPGGEDGDVAVLGDVCLKVVVNSGIHDGGHELGVVDRVAAVLRLERGAEGLEVDRGELGAGAGLEGLGVAGGLEDVGAQRLGEAAVRDAERALEVLDDALGE
mmetsp:Transcript_1811/g.5520  ORF Transcript_1811/g.5520 Transcript_1811/m.5520 type:complete len:290 (-) Transcript_1811:955-1824(-)